jgi:uncharacterized protein
MKKLFSIALIAAACAAQAQTASAPASAAKKDLVQRLVTLQQPSVEGLTRGLAERPLRQMLGQAQQVLAGMPEDKRKAAATKVDALVNQYLADTTPIVKDKAAKVGQAALGPLFEEKFSEEELRQLLVALESPAYKKYQQILPEADGALKQKIGNDLSVLDPKFEALVKEVGAVLGVSGSAEAGKPEAKPPAKPKAKK